ncbi:S1C family serine protease [Rhodoligotrophos defluvii]|uniref:S1C family serine protease n=1 Tax=Rhodoligotrophos defluvii TaxID=2561934 RepID=UPI0010C9EA99|nr:serine protease [Rhodoligotrophos defluvii]
MRTERLTLAQGVAFVVVLVVLLGLGSFVATPAKGGLAGSTVKIVLPTGNGSGVHIGSGRILTAAHVTKLAPDGKLKVATDDGRILDGEVLWQSEVYDVALVRVEAPESVAASDLSCRTPAVGESFTAKGSPLGQDFISTWGRVSAPVRTIGPWKEGVLMDLSIAPGSSGGPVFDSAQHVIGIVVGMFRPQPGFGVIVPGSTVCALLAR